MARRAVFFAPHPDDETLACGGTIALKVRRGEEVSIVFMTDGRNSHLHALGIASDPKPGELAGIRKEEAIRAAGILGVPSENLLFLEFDSAELRSDNAVVAERVANVLQKARPDEVYYPDSTDSHRTHRAAHEVVEKALSDLAQHPPGYTYVVWRSEALKDNMGRDELTVDVREVLSLKRQAIAEYRSQTAVFSKHQTRPLLSEPFLERFLTGRETFFV
jgi:LmbE family N-acetylglucosaminyl deacetylase